MWSVSSGFQPMGRAPQKDQQINLRGYETEREEEEISSDTWLSLESFLHSFMFLCNIKYMFPSLGLKHLFNETIRSPGGKGPLGAT